MVILRSSDEIERLRASNIIVAEILNELKGNVKTGVSTIDLERICEEEVRKRKVIPAFKGYRGYPYCICTSVNEQVVHGMPSKRVLKGGDIVSIDLGILHNGYYGDSAVTVPVGRVSEEVNRLIDVAEKALYLGINEARVGSRLSDIGAAIQGYVEANGFSVVRDFVGHGIGQSLHEAPQVPNFGVRGKGVRLKAGMVLAIEPMINMGRCEVVILGDGWTAVTKDGSLSAHFEHSIAITNNEPYILSRL
ncbi:MAG: type I methionyl aminopeptidase [Deltaproteobacteria bacterium GWC2_42_11]|nr:MAG: type I methionyl aminopeptidase [Deltaproteobacteria bacterium GWC2_42_11]